MAPGRAAEEGELGELLLQGCVHREHPFTPANTFIHSHSEITHKFSSYCKVGEGSGTRLGVSSCKGAAVVVGGEARGVSSLRTSIVDIYNAA